MKQQVIKDIESDLYFAGRHHPTILWAPWVYNYNRIFPWVYNLTGAWGTGSPVEDLAHLEAQGFKVQVENAPDQEVN